MESGSLIGQKYRLKQKIGDGATCEVWEAAHTQTGRLVAIKMILRPTEVFRHRLLREARICGEIAHRNVIEVLDAGQLDNGDPYLVMPLLQGETLGELIRRQYRLDAVTAAQIGRDVARALSAAHAKTIIHRDLKPANIFLHNEPGVEGAVVKVLDFGIGKNLSSEASLATVEGGLMGSPAYMSPEQVRCDPKVDHRTDIWSLGVVLFEMLAGRRPFEGGTAQEVVAKIARGEVPRLSKLLRRVDPALEGLVWHCMQVDREQRVQSAGDVARMLEGFGEGRESWPAAGGMGNERSSSQVPPDRRSSQEISPVLGGVPAGRMSAPYAVQGARGGEVVEDDATRPFTPTGFVNRAITEAQGSGGDGLVGSGMFRPMPTEKLAVGLQGPMAGGVRDWEAGENAATLKMKKEAQAASPVMPLGPRGTIKIGAEAAAKIGAEAMAMAGSGVWPGSGGSQPVATDVPTTMPLSGQVQVGVESGVFRGQDFRGWEGDGRRVGLALGVGVLAAVVVVGLVLGVHSLLRGPGAASGGVEAVVSGEAVVVPGVAAVPSGVETARVSGAVVPSGVASAAGAASGTEKKVAPVVTAAKEAPSPLPRKGVAQPIKPAPTPPPTVTNKAPVVKGPPSLIFGEELSSPPPPAAPPPAAGKPTKPRKVNPTGI